MTHQEIKPKQAGNIQKAAYPEPLLYPESDDIYNRSYEEQDIDPGDITQNKEPGKNEEDFGNDVPGDQLDVPGSELDDIRESIGSEDEENNYYSIGGDNHNDLEEDKGD